MYIYILLPFFKKRISQSSSFVRAVIAFLRILCMNFALFVLTYFSRACLLRTQDRCKSFIKI